jgi:hypothetical protein
MLITIALIAALSHVAFAAPETSIELEPPVPLGVGALDEFDNLQLLPARDEKDAKPRLVLGDAIGFLHVYEQRQEGAYEEVWISEFLESGVSGTLLVDTDADELKELLVYTNGGRFFLFDLIDYHTIWSNPPNEYEKITSMIVRNVDDDEQVELIMVADGKLVLYDGKDRFEQWRSDQSNLTSTDIIVGDADGDGSDEIILNDGFVFDARFLDLEWESPDAFGERLGLLDIDGDGIVEVIGEFNGRHLRVFDIDERSMKITQR